MPEFIDLTNQKFSRLTVLDRANTDGRRTKWTCRCDCGNTKKVDAAHLRNGHTRSCGCLQKDHPNHFIHGDGAKGARRGKEYRVWSHMCGRCLNPTDHAYKNYGGRGITVCDEWRSSYPAFLADMGRCPPGKTLGRINNDLGYSKSNCRWEDWIQQQRNRRGNRIITIGNRTEVLAKWVEMSGLPYSTVQGRLHLGWSYERAFWTPRANAR